MGEHSTARYYAAVAASGVSLLAWIGTIGGVVATVYVAATAGPAIEAVAATGALLVVAVSFARLEARLYRMDAAE